MRDGASRERSVVGSWMSMVRSSWRPRRAGMRRRWRVRDGVCKKGSEAVLSTSKVGTSIARAGVPVGRWGEESRERRELMETGRAKEIDGKRASERKGEIESEREREREREIER